MFVEFATETYIFFEEPHYPYTVLIELKYQTILKIGQQGQ